ncbi:hypothetical protein DNAM_630 [Pseudomonas phage BroderSalsa]|nr:hypothetical protein DNAM_630 [Pseudomonas phage BroderSalsa]
MVKLKLLVLIVLVGILLYLCPPLLSINSLVFNVLGAALAVASFYYSLKVLASLCRG